MMIRFQLMKGKRMADDRVAAELGVRISIRRRCKAADEDKNFKHSTS